MALDPSIILQGQSVNALSALAGGTQVAQQQGAFQRDSAFNRLLNDQGAQIAAGDKNALAQLSRFDPSQAMNIQAHHEAQARARAAAARAAQNFADQQKLKAEIEQGKGMLKQAAIALQTGDERAWNMVAAELGANGLTPSADNYGLLTALVTGSEEGLMDAVRGPEPVEGKVINGQLVNGATGDVIGDYRTKEQFTQITGNAAMARGLDPTKVYNVGPDGKTTPVESGQTINITNQDGGSEKFYDTLDTKNATMFGELLDGGMAVNSKLAQVDQMQSLLEQSPSGAEAAFKTMLGDWGVATEGLDTLQAARAVINQLVPAQRQPGSGPMSDADLELFKQSLPRLINQPGGNAMIANTMRGILMYQAAQGDIAMRVASREITPANGLKMLKELKNPLAQYRREGAVAIGGYIIEEAN